MFGENVGMVRQDLGRLGSHVSVNLAFVIECQLAGQKQQGPGAQRG